VRGRSPLHRGFVLLPLTLTLSAEQTKVAQRDPTPKVSLTESVTPRFLCQRDREAVMATFPLAAAGTIAMAFREGMDALFEALAKVHGNKAGPWFDELEADALRRAKGKVGEGMHIADEVALIRSGVEALKIQFSGYRSKLSAN
jgi:hypothetical protein